MPSNGHFLVRASSTHKPQTARDRSELATSHIGHTPPPRLRRHRHNFSEYITSKPISAFATAPTTARPQSAIAKSKGDLTSLSRNIPGSEVRYHKKAQAKPHAPCLHKKNRIIPAVHSSWPTRPLQVSRAAPLPAIHLLIPPCPRGPLRASHPEASSPPSNPPTELQPHPRPPPTRAHRPMPARPPPIMAPPTHRTRNNRRRRPR